MHIPLRLLDRLRFLKAIAQENLPPALKVMLAQLRVLKSRQATARLPQMLLQAAQTRAMSTYPLRRQRLLPMLWLLLRHFGRLFRTKLTASRATPLTRRFLACANTIP